MKRQGKQKTLCGIVARQFNYQRASEKMIDDATNIVLTSNSKSTRRRRRRAKQDTGAAKTPTSRPKIVTVLRVKNEEQYIGAALESLVSLAGDIVLLDDGSTDATPSMVRRRRDVHYHRQDDMELDEGRDRTALYKWALELEPDWIFTLDGDEALAREGAEQMVLATQQAPDDVNVFQIFMAIMASKNSRYTGPQPFAYWYMPRLFRVRDAVKTHKFKSQFDNNMHCGCVPEIRNEKRLRLNAWIQYYGYESKDAIAKKLDFYGANDPKHAAHLKRLVAGRRALQRNVWNVSPDCREIGITGTVTYE